MKRDPKRLRMTPKLYLLPVKSVPVSHVEMPPVMFLQNIMGTHDVLPLDVGIVMEKYTVICSRACSHLNK